MPSNEPMFSDDHPAYSGLPTFYKFPFITDPAELRKQRIDVAVVGAPCDISVYYRGGARFGPRAIRQASYLTAHNFYNLDLSIEPLKYLKCADAGDARTVPGDLERSIRGVKEKIAQVVSAGCRLMILGGDHSITFPAAQAVAEHYGPGSVGLIHFDAHADTAPDMEGVLLSHGSPMRRLIESGAIPGKNFVQVGLHGYWPPPEVWDWMKQQGMRSHFMTEVHKRGFDAVLGTAIQEAMDGPKYAYLSIDIDVVDPGAAPGTGAPEPGGLQPADVLRAAQRIAKELDLVAMDVVEVSPPYDTSEITAILAHRLVLETISGLAARKRDGA